MMCALFRYFSTCFVATPSLSKWHRHFLHRVAIVVFCNVVLFFGAFGFAPEDSRVLKGKKCKEFFNIILCMFVEFVLA